MITFINQAEFQVKLDRELKGAIDKAEQAMKNTISEAEQEAKRNAPWTDRTGNARNSLTGAYLGNQNGVISAVLYGGMHYSIWLELCNQGRYRIIWPTIEASIPRLNYWLKRLIV